MDYSSLYRKQLATAIVEASNLGFTRPSMINPGKPVPDEVLRATSELLGSLSAAFDLILPGYWGNSCQTLSTNIFAHLNSRGIPADIVLGNVVVNGTDEFEATLEEMRQEVRATKPLDGTQKVHAWICLGDDTVVDAALPPRLVKHYAAPSHFEDVIFIGRAAELIAGRNRLSIAEEAQVGI